MAEIARDQGEHARARSLYRQSLSLWWEIGNRLSLPTALEGMAGVKGAEKQAAAAARLFGAAAALREALGTPIPPADRAADERDVAAVRAAPDEPAFAPAWAEGQALTLDQAITCALEK